MSTRKPSKKKIYFLRRVFDPGPTVEPPPTRRGDSSPDSSSVWCPGPTGATGATGATPRGRRGECRHPIRHRFGVPDRRFLISPSRRDDSSPRFASFGNRNDTTCTRRCHFSRGRRDFHRARHQQVGVVCSTP